MINRKEFEKARQDVVDSLFTQMVRHKLSIRQVGRALDIQPATLCKWKRGALMDDARTYLNLRTLVAQLSEMSPLLSRASRDNFIRTLWR